jgi:hypothetical protein
MLAMTCDSSLDDREDPIVTTKEIPAQQCHSYLLICLSACLLVCLSACLFVCLSACLLVSLSACLLICLSLCLPVCLSAYLPVCLSALFPSHVLTKTIFACTIEVLCKSTLTTEYITTLEPWILTY